MSSVLSDSQYLKALILHELLLGNAPRLPTLQAQIGTERAARAWHDLAETGSIVCNEVGELLATYPLSASPTRHRVEAGAFAAWANCAIDALAVPALVGEPGTIRSTCATCGAEIAIEVEGTTLRQTPPGVVVAHGGLSDCCDRPVLEARCPYINFFCNEDHLKEWQRPSTWTGKILPLPQALAVAVDRFRPIIDVYGLVYRGSESVANPTGM